MKRLIDYHLLQWKHRRTRKSLILRGARQVGKTYAIRQLGKTYENFVEINFEQHVQARAIFDQDLDPHRILKILSAMFHQPIIAGKTLLFFDEAQLVPQTIIALRYFYEIMPELHVIAAGSLLDFAIAQVGVPVGRVEFLHMYPLSFLEYAIAHKKSLALQGVLEHDHTKPYFESIHQQLLLSVAEYIAIGGMPEVVNAWVVDNNGSNLQLIISSIMTSYRHDFKEYAKTVQIKYVESIFKQIPQQLGKKFKYNLVEGEFRKRELAPALDLLETAGIARKIYYSAGQGIPLGAQIDPLDYKVMFLDVGLAQHSLGLHIAEWLLQPDQQFINKGALVESFVGQEFAAYADPHQQQDLYYWHKDSAPQQAEIDFLLQLHGKIVPVEVKSGDGRTLRSLHYFLEKHNDSPYGLRFSTNNFSVMDNIHSYPLYAIARVMSDAHPGLKAAIESLL